MKLTKEHEALKAVLEDTNFIHLSSGTRRLIRSSVNTCGDYHNPGDVAVLEKIREALIGEDLENCYLRICKIVMEGGGE